MGDFAPPPLIIFYSYMYMKHQNQLHMITGTFSEMATFKVHKSMTYISMEINRSHDLILTNHCTMFQIHGFKDVRTMSMYTVYYNNALVINTKYQYVEAKNQI